MAVAVKLSDQGIQIVDKARKNKGFKKEDKKWAALACTSLATLKRCQKGESIEQPTMVNILKPIDVPYDAVVEEASTEPVSRSEYDDTTCYGRTKELADLERWVTDEKCRVVTIYGAKGIGKTTVARQLVKQVKSKFKDVHYRGVQELQSNDEKLPEIMKTLKQNRSLVVLDGWESLFQGGKLAGIYRDECTAFGEFLKNACEIHHSSCLLVTSLEEPKEVIVHNGHKSFVKSLHLKGLDVDSGAINLFQDNSFSGNEQRLEEVIQRYAGNPLLLTLVTKFITDTYGGSVQQFLELNQLAFGDICSLLDEQYARLSKLERDIIVLFALENRPFPLTTLHKEVSRAKGLPYLDYQGALKSLIQRSLIEVHQGEEVFYNLHPYLTQYAIQIFCNDLYQQTTRKESNDDVKSFPSFQSNASDPVRRQIEAQVNSLLNSNLSTEEKNSRISKIIFDIRSRR